MGNRWIRWIFSAAVLLFVFWFFYDRIYVPKSTYTYVTAKRGDLPLTVFGIATVGAKSIHPVGSNYGGKILEVLKDQGEWVKKGEVIARLDPVDLPEKLAQARAVLEKIRRETEAARRELEGIEARRELVLSTFKRYSRLFEQGFAAEAEYDKARTDLASLDAQIAASKARIDSSLSEQASARKSIEALQKRIERMEVRSPIEGLVIARNAQAGQSLLLQQPIVTVVDPKEVWVRAYIDERISGSVAVGQRASIRLRSMQDRVLPGRVVRIEAQSDPVTEERIVNVAFEKVPMPFYINEQAEVVIETGKIKNALLLPVKVIVRGGVWVYRNGKARFVKIEIIGRNDKLAAVKGVVSGDRILVPESHKKPLYDGMNVRI